MAAEVFRLKRRKESISAEEVLGWIDRELEEENLGIGVQNLREARRILAWALEDIAR